MRNGQDIDKPQKMASKRPRKHSVFNSMRKKLEAQWHIHKPICLNIEKYQVLTITQNWLSPYDSNNSTSDKYSGKLRNHNEV